MSQIARPISWFSRDIITDSQWPTENYNMIGQWIWEPLYVSLFCILARAHWALSLVFVSLPKAMIAWKDTKLLQDLLEVFWYYRGPPSHCWILSALLVWKGNSTKRLIGHPTLRWEASKLQRSMKLKYVWIFFLPRPINYQ